MKKSNQHLKLFLAGITVIGFIFNGPASFAGGDGKPDGKPWPCPEKNAKMASQMKPDANVLATGKEIWSQQCKSCHGKTGKGDGTKAESIAISCGDFTSESFQKKSDGELFWKTTEGRKPMPSFKLKLTDIERWSVILYTRTFKKTDTEEALKTK